MSARTPRTPGRVVPTGPLPSSRVSMSSSTFALAVATGAYQLGEQPGEDEAGAGVSLVAPILRERNLGNSLEAWDQPVRLHTEALSSALGIDWTKYNANLEAEASAPAAASARGSGPASSRAKGKDGTSKDGAGKSAKSAKSGSGKDSSGLNSPVAVMANTLAGDGGRGKATTSPPGQRGNADKSPRRKAYTRDGRMIDISMRSEEEASMIERVQNHSTLSVPSASHPSVVGKYSFDGSGVPNIITPRSAGITPRSVGVTPRSARGIDSNALHTAIGAAFGGDTSARRAMPPTGSGISSPAPPVCNSPGRGSKQAAAGSKPTAAGKAGSGGGAATPKKSKKSASALFFEEQVRGQDYRKTHIDYSSRVQPETPAYALQDLKTTTMKMPSGTATDRGGETTTRAARGGVPARRNSLPGARR